MPHIDNPPTGNHDRSPQKSVIFDPNICHGQNGINGLSHTRALPPLPEHERPAAEAIMMGCR